MGADGRGAAGVDAEDERMGEGLGGGGGGGGGGGEGGDDKIAQTGEHGQVLVWIAGSEDAVRKGAADGTQEQYHIHSERRA